MQGAVHWYSYLQIKWYTRKFTFVQLISKIKVVDQFLTITELTPEQHQFFEWCKTYYLKKLQTHEVKLHWSVL